MHPAWARDICDQCQAADVPFMLKQWGEWAPSVVPGSATMERIGKKAAGRLLDDRTWDEFPTERTV
jgi:protein gp37